MNLKVHWLLLLLTRVVTADIVFLDQNGNKTGPLEISKWEGAFQNDTQVNSNENQFPKILPDFVSRDNNRFTIRASQDANEVVLSSEKTKDTLVVPLNRGVSSPLLLVSDLDDRNYLYKSSLRVEAQDVITAKVGEETAVALVTPKKRLTLRFLALQGSKGIPISEKYAEMEVNFARARLAQCGIVLDYEFKEIDVPQSRSFLPSRPITINPNPGAPRKEEATLLREIGTPGKLTVLYLDGIQFEGKNRQFYSLRGISYPKRIYPTYERVVLISRHKMSRFTLAHELAHILGNSATHSNNLSNLMHSGGNDYLETSSKRLTKQQCEAFLKNPLLTPVRNLDRVGQL